MSTIRPFKALRPPADRALQVAAVPYDVVNTAEARKLAEGNRWSFLHISRSEIDLPDHIDPFSPDVYKKASENFQELSQNCHFVVDSTPMLYLYRLKMGEHEQTGVVGAFSIDEYDSNKIRKHERTRQDKEDDRTHHILKLSAQTGPVLLTYRDVPEIITEMKRIEAGIPIYHFTSEDGISHSIWSVESPSNLVQLFARHVSTLYIADGHHRAAAASRARTELARVNSKHRGDEEYNFVMAVAFPGSQLKILPYYRAIKDLGSMTEADFLEKIRERFYVSPGSLKDPTPGEFGMFLKSGQYFLRPKKESRDFDVTFLQDYLLEPVLGIRDPRADKRIEFVGGIRGTQELERLVNTGGAAVAFSVHPVQLNDLMEVADQGGIMPPKSTWFEPKLRDGLLCHQI